MVKRQAHTPVRSCLGHPLLGWWTLVSAAGGAMVGGLEEGGFQFFATLVLTGPVLGLAQWLVIRHYLRGAGGWILASSLGWLIGINLRILLGGLSDRLVQLLWQEFSLWEVLWLNVVREPIVLFVFGAAQWLMLRRHFSGAGWWILASAVSGVVKGAVSASVCAVACQAVARSAGNAQINPMVATSALSYGAGWAAYGLITGLVLVWLLQGLHRSVSRH
jgi:hypothetical protein